MNRFEEVHFGGYQVQDDCIEVKTTFDNKEEAAKVVGILLNEKLIACGQIHEIESYYVWHDKKEISKEFMLVMKTKAKLYSQVEKIIQSNHSYVCPEIIATKITELSNDYYDYIARNTKN